MARARVSQYVVEALIPTDAFDPTTPTGVGVSQYVVEALLASPGRVRVSQYVVEALIADNDQQSPAPSTGGGVRVWGHAG
jgi:hypothetical protein